MKHLLSIFFILAIACNNIHLKPADVYTFKFSKDSLITGILIEDHIEENTHWYGFAFTNIVSKNAPSIATIKHSKIAGRKVESAIDKKGYETGLDILYIKDSLLHTGNIHKIGTINMNFKKFNIASYGFAFTYDEIEQTFNFERMRRKDAPDHYTQQMKLDKFRPDEYFEIADFLN